MIPKAIFNWSSGKDSAFAIYKIMKSNQYEIVSLLTSISKENRRISMHGVREELLEIQAKSIGLPLLKMKIPNSTSMKIYDSIMKNILIGLKEKGVTHSIFGDIFLEDLRNYREEKLNKLGLKAEFPLWKQNTSELIQEFLDLGFKTIVTCVNEYYLDKSFVGRIIDDKFILALPENIDPCGENGEFHTFTFDGPIFRFPIEFKMGEIIRKTYPKPKTDTHDEISEDYGFWFCDLIP